MEEHVKEYNSLFEESPFFQSMAQKVMAEARVRGAQRMVTTVVKYPTRGTRGLINCSPF